ncbi:hypothetical protein ABIF16_005365 [Bradyrhizobium elkanii]
MIAFLGQAVHRLAVGLRRLPYSHLAAVEDRNLELDVEAALAERRGFGIVRPLVDAGDVEQRDEARRLGEIERLGERDDFHPCNLQIDAVTDRGDLDRRLLQRLLRQRRQPVRNPEAEIAVPQAEQARQPLARTRRILPRAGEVGGDLGVEHLLAGLVELVHAAGLAELPGELRGRLRGCLRIRQQRDHLICRDGRDMAAPHLGGKPQGGERGLELRLAEALARDLGADRQGRERKDVADHLPLDLAGTVSGDAGDREGRVRRQAVGDVIGLRQRQLVVGGLQALVVQQRDLHGGIRRQIACEQPFHRGVDARGPLSAANEGDVLADRLRGHLGDDAHTAIGRERGASRERGCQQQDRRDGRISHGALLMFGLGRRGHAVVALAPGLRRRRTQAAVRRDRRAVANAGPARRRIRRIASNGDRPAVGHAADERRCRDDGGGQPR